MGLYYNFFKKFCDTDEYEELEMDTDSHYLALSGENELTGTSYVLKIPLICLLRMQPAIFSPELAVMSTRNMIRESRVSSKKSLDVQKCCACVRQTYGCYDKQTNKNKFSSKGHTKKHWKTVAMDQCQSIAKCWRNLLM